MLYFNRIDVFEGLDVNKTSASKESDICHYWYFLNYSAKFQPNVCNRCHDLLMVSMNHKSPIFLKDVDIEKVLVSHKTFFSEKNYKYFIGYLYNDNNVKPLHIIIPKASTYVKSYDGQTKWM